MIEFYEQYVMVFLVTCPVLTATTNGRITCSLGSDNQPTNGDICFFTCNSGYVLDGSATRVCLSTHLGGSWTGNDVVCNTGMCVCDAPV